MFRSSLDTLSQPIQDLSDTRLRPIEELLSVNDGSAIRSFNGTIIETEGSEILSGFGTNDVIYAFGGNDTVFGAECFDTITGSTGADQVFGGNGNDVYYVDSMTDIVFASEK